MSSLGKRLNLGLNRNDIVRKELLTILESNAWNANFKVFHEVAQSFHKIGRYNLEADSSACKVGGKFWSHMSRVFCPQKLHNLAQTVARCTDWRFIWCACWKQLEEGIQEYLVERGSVFDLEILGEHIF